MDKDFFINNESEIQKFKEIHEKTQPKYLGDEYLLYKSAIDTITNNDPLTYLMTRINNFNLPINMPLFEYVSNKNMRLVRELFFTVGVNRVYQKDPEKYKKIWEGQDPKYPHKRRYKLEFENNGVKSSSNKDTNQIYG